MEGLRYTYTTTPLAIHHSLYAHGTSGVASRGVVESGVLRVVMMYVDLWNSGMEMERGETQHPEGEYGDIHHVSGSTTTPHDHRVHSCLHRTCTTTVWSFLPYASSGVHAHYTPSAW